MGDLVGCRGNAESGGTCPGRVRVRVAGRAVEPARPAPSGGGDLRRARRGARRRRPRRRHAPALHAFDRRGGPRRGAGGRQPAGRGAAGRGCRLARRARDRRRGGLRVAPAARLARRRPQRADRHPRALAVHRRLLPVRLRWFPPSNAATGCRDSGPRTCARSAGSCSCSSPLVVLAVWVRARSRRSARARRSCRSRGPTCARDARRRRAGGAGDRRDTSGRRARRAARRGSPGRRRGR